MILTPARTAARRALVVLVALLATLLGSATAASADPAGPTSYRATVTSITVDATGVTPSGVTAEVFGGDSYLVLSVDPGHTVTVFGYDQREAEAAGRAPEQYLQILADGIVQINARSVAKYQNEGRYGIVGLPAEAQPGAVPAWETVGSGGEYAWHDHRIHWMSPSLPPQLDPAGPADQPVFDFAVELLVDGEPVTVAGELVWGPSGLEPLPLVLVVMVALLALVAMQRAAVAPLVALAGAVFAAGVATALSIEAPPGAPLATIQLILPGMAALLAVVAFVRRSDPDQATTLAGLAGIGLIAVGMTNAGVFTQPELPTGLPDTVARGMYAAILGTGLALAVAAGRSLLSGSVTVEQPAAGGRRRRAAALPDLDEDPSV